MLTNTESAGLLINRRSFGHLGDIFSVSTNLLLFNISAPSACPLAPIGLCECVGCCILRMLYILDFLLWVDFYSIHLQYGTLKSVPLLKYSIFCLLLHTFELTSQSDETLNRGPRLRITFLCWWDVNPSSNQTKHLAFSIFSKNVSVTTRFNFEVVCSYSEVYQHVSKYFLIFKTSK